LLYGRVRTSSTCAWVVTGLNSKRTMCSIGIVLACWLVGDSVGLVWIFESRIFVDSDGCLLLLTQLNYIKSCDC
jgi:hypothetical protein